MLKGIDISHHNKYQFVNGTIRFENHDFVMMKATEGKSYEDPMMETYVKALLPDQLYGFYHYARPENNSPLAEAKNFVDTIGVYANQAMLALDWEDKALKCDIKWAKEWLDYVYMYTGKKPLFYCSSSYTKKLKPILDNDNGLWVAHYTKADKPKVYTYPFYTMWQYTSEPYDKDYFNGGKVTWKKYCNY